MPTRCLEGTGAGQEHAPWLQLLGPFPGQSGGSHAHVRGLLSHLLRTQVLSSQLALSYFTVFFWGLPQASA